MFENWSHHLSTGQQNGLNRDAARINILHYLTRANIMRKMIARTWSCAMFAAISASLNFLCASAGARADLLNEIYIVRVSTVIAPLNDPILSIAQISGVRTALESFLEATSGLNKLLGAALEEFLQRLHIPEAVVVYAINYCTEHRLADGSLEHQCQMQDLSSADALAGLQIFLRVLYLTSACLSLFACVMQIIRCTRWSRKVASWPSVGLWLSLALSASLLGTLLVIVFSAVVYVIAVKSIPLAAPHFDMGVKFFVITSAACIGNALALCH